MTYEDVKNIRKSPTHSIVDGGSDYKELSRMIDDAIEKQIKKKPIMGKSKNICFDDFFCPSCNKRIISRLDGEWIVGKTQKYCDECGQALDWGDNE